MTSQQAFVGIDFGTTNSAVGLAGATGPAQLALLPGPAGTTATTWRTVLYFDPDGVRAGAPAIDRYLETEGDGRLVQSIKSHLASASFTRTTILGRTWTLEHLVAEFLRRLSRAAATAGQPLGRRAVLGRPVRYWGQSDPDDEARALARMAAAAGAAGYDEVVFEFEPVAAAARYADRLDHDELILVADFGGGTSDFSLVRVGPGQVAGAGAGADGSGAVLATGGIGIGGDSFDARIIDAVVAPALGRGSSYRDEMGAVTPVPAWPYTRLRRWHHLSFLKAPDTLRLLARVLRGALEPARVQRLVDLVDDDLGLPLHRAVEHSKRTLSREPAGALVLAPLGLGAQLSRDRFEQWIAEELVAIDQVVVAVLDQAGVAAADVESGVRHRRIRRWCRRCARCSARGSARPGWWAATS